jgi:hypothetical protein
MTTACAERYVRWIWTAVITPTQPSMLMEGLWTVCECDACVDGSSRRQYIHDVESTERVRPVARLGRFAAFRVPGRWLPRLWVRSCRSCGRKPAIVGRLCLACNNAGSH